MFCNAVLGDGEAGPFSVRQVPPEGFDVNARLEGRPIKDELAPDCILDHNSLKPWTDCSNCGAVHEPLAVTGKGPQGNPYGRGRGELTKRDQMRVDYYVNRAPRAEL